MGWVKRGDRARVERRTGGLRHAVVGGAGVGATIAILAGLLAGCATQHAAAPESFLTARETAASPTALPRSLPVAASTRKVDKASQLKARSWLAGAAVPAGSVASIARPAGVASAATPEMWCSPMADAVGYWTLPGTDADDAMAWLKAHASRGMVIASASGNPAAEGATNVGGTVVDEPSPMAIEALVFTVTPIGAGSGIRADAFVKASTSVCATTSPGTMLGIGG